MTTATPRPIIHVFKEINEGVKNQLQDFKKDLLTQEANDELLTRKDNKDTVKINLKKGIIPASKIGRRIVIKRIDIENSLNEVKSLKYKR
jgi:hypothetical protein